MFQPTAVERRLVFVGNIECHFVTRYYLDGLTFDLDDSGRMERWWLGSPDGWEDGHDLIHLTTFLEFQRTHERRRR